MSKDPETTIRAYHRGIARWSDDALAAILECFTEDAVWHNMPIEPAVGKPAIAALLRQLAPTWGRVETEIKNLAPRGTTFIVERVDTHFFPGGKRIVMPVCGVFETRGGLISECRDYFDLRTWKKQGGA